MTDLNDLPDVAADIALHLSKHFDSQTAQQRQVLCLAEEVGEFVGAYRRWAGEARRTGTHADMATELADIVVTAFVTGHELEIDLADAITDKLAAIYARGWREGSRE